MHNLLRTPLFPVFFVGCTLPLVLTVCSTFLSAQVQSTRLVHVSVTDPLNRFVTGIDRENFQIVENGVPRPITGFSDVNSPISLAVVSETQLAVSNSDGPNDELIQTRSVSGALRQLAASKNSRKALVITTGADAQAAPGNIQVVQTTPDNLSRQVVELRNQYLIQFESPNASAGVEVVLQQPRGLPPLRPHLK